MDGWRRWRADLAEPEEPTSRKDLPFLALSAMAISVIAQLTDPGTVGDLVLLAPAVLAFVVRGLAPRLPAEVFAGLVLVPVTLVVSRHGDLEGALFLAPLMMLYASSHLGSRARAGAILAVSAAAPWLISEVLTPEADVAWTPWALANVFTFVLGTALRRQKLLIRDLEEAREALAQQAVAEERRRIARELHDLAGHTLAAVLLHVTGARHVLRRDVDEAERALLEAETVGRTSLDQIRATVVALRAHEQGTDRALAGSADLRGLIDEYKRAGLVIDDRVDPAATELDGAVGIALHRIAREALANVARHAPQNTVEFVIEVDRHHARLVVADHGRPGPPPKPSDGHFGLVGMRERARSLGGDLEAGPTPDGWQVDARLPVALTDAGKPTPS